MQEVAKKPAGIDVSPTSDVHETRYSILWYKKDQRIGIRQKFGEKKQICSFGGSKCGKSEGVLRKIGGMAIDRLSMGTLEETDCKQWCEDEIDVPDLS